MHTSKMIETNPAEAILAKDRLSACIEACFDCAQACAACADACLGEENIAMLMRCIRLNQDCGDICIATGTILSRQQQPDARLLRSQLDTCLLACQVCADECAKHASKHEHCRVCADACRTCATACQDAIGAFGPAPQAVKH